MHTVGKEKNSFTINSEFLDLLLIKRHAPGLNAIPSLNPSLDLAK